MLVALPNVAEARITPTAQANADSFHCAEDQMARTIAQRQKRARYRRNLRAKKRVFRESVWFLREPDKAAMQLGSVDWRDTMRKGPCVYCGLPAKNNTLDHIQPKSKGGPDGWENMAPACAQCNRRKHVKPLLQFLLELSARKELLTLGLKRYKVRNRGRSGGSASEWPACSNTTGLRI